MRGSSEFGVLQAEHKTWSKPAALLACSIFSHLLHETVDIVQNVSDSLFVNASLKLLWQNRKEQNVYLTHPSSTAGGGVEQVHFSSSCDGDLNLLIAEFLLVLLLRVIASCRPLGLQLCEALGRWVSAACCNCLLARMRTSLYIRLPGTRSNAKDRLGGRKHSQMGLCSLVDCISFMTESIAAAAMAWLDVNSCCVDCMTLPYLKLVLHAVETG